ncbi:TIGR03013 family PEP-CTERM/XrtA system glycosyltransferase [Desulfobacterales bacterium HSG16]|nr:TIGR03013 family PEP-CTERM/XrtA system glycosyltransferase [Desulfobacterales bacterium HSG16]
MLRILKQYYPVRNVVFVIGEGLMICASVLMATWMVMGTEFIVSDLLLPLKVILIAATCQTCLYYNDLYDFRVTDTFLEFGLRLLQALGAAAIILAIIYLLFPIFIILKGILIISIGFVILLIISWRMCYTMILNKGLFDQNIMILGSGSLADRIIHEISDRKDCGYSISFVSLEAAEDEKIIKDLEQEVPCSNNKHKELDKTAQKLGIRRVVVAIKERRGGVFPTNELVKCRMEGIDVLEGNTFYERLTGKLDVEHINPGWLIFSGGFRKSWSKRTMKRILDLLLALILQVLVLPLMMFTAILIKFDSKGPVLFSQERVGEKRKPYKIYKFRSMKTDAEKVSGPVWAQADDDRVTRVGHFIRKWRVDELPQLWNVIRGEMSFVGPRPEREFFVKGLEYIIPYYGERFEVKPGLTGWAQVNYGYGASVEDAIEKLNYDMFYMKNMSILLDLVIVLRTVKTVLFGQGAR